MKRNTMALCRNCPCWEISDINPNIGECRCYPPAGDDESDSIFPETGANQWCREHPDFELHEPVKFGPGSQIVPIPKEGYYSALDAYAKAELEIRRLRKLLDEKGESS